MSKIYATTTHEEEGDTMHTDTHTTTTHEVHTERAWGKTKFVCACGWVSSTTRTPAARGNLASGRAVAEARAHLDSNGA